MSRTAAAPRTRPMESAARTPRESAAAPAGAFARVRARLQRLGGRLRPSRTPLLGQVLLRERVITRSQLHKALQQQRELDEPLGRAVVQMGLADEAEVLAAINKHYHIAAAALTDNIAALIRSRAESRRSLSRLRRLLRVRFSLVLLGAIWATILLLSLVLLGRHKAQLTESAVRLGVASVGYLAESAKPALLGEDVLQLNRAVKAVLNAEDVRYAIVTDSQGIVRAHTDPRRIGRPLPARAEAGEARRAGPVTYTRRSDGRGGTVLHLVQPVTFQSKLLGRAQVGLSLDGVDGRVREETILIGLLSLLILGLGLVLAFRQGGALLRPLTAWLASSPAGGQPQEFHVQVRADHAFEDLAASFDAISQELAQKLVVERSFGRYVNPGVLELIRANPEETWLRGTRNEASVLFTDVRGFTGIAEAREPEAVVEALNEYFAIATAAIVAEGGYVDKYIGDGVLAVFGVPAELPDHALRAVKAAVTMQKDLRRRARNSLSPLLHRIGISVNSGLVVAGNIGSADKMEYTVVGDSVNVASRLNGLAEAGEIVISDSVAALIPRHLVTLSEMEPRPMKGKLAPVRAFKVLKTEF